MNKQELIKEFREVGIYSLNIFGTEIKAIPTEIAITSIEQLDEPKPVKVPQCVADWYEENKDDFEGNLFRYIINISSIFDGAKLNEFDRWFLNASTKPFQTLVNMHQFGYEVEKEKRYTVKIKGNIKENMLVYGELLERYYFTKSFSLNNAIYSHTRKQLEEAGFGWVFSCEGIEIEEME